MLDWTIENENGIKHYIVTRVTNANIEIHVTRVRTTGGRPLRIVKDFPLNAEYMDCIKKVENICNLDDEIYAMLNDHQMEA